MATYQSSAGGDIGSLLRLIQEEKSQSILQAPPESDPNSPVREQIQEPVFAPEQPGGTRNLSLRPEGDSSVVSPVESLQAGGQTPVSPTSPVSPVSPIGPGGVTADGGVVAPTRPQPAFSEMAGPGEPGGSGTPSPASANMSRAAGPSMPSIGTRISGPSASFSRASTPSYSTPSRPQPTPAPSRPQNTPQASSFGGYGKLGAIGGVVQNLAKKQLKSPSPINIGLRLLPNLIKSAGRLPLFMLNPRAAAGSVNGSKRG